MNDLTNKEFGDYHILRKIGSGAMAEVYLAEQRSLGRRVALKILKPELAGDETYIRRFVREARAIAALLHPNLVQIFQADCFDGYWFIAQEYVQGQSLQQRIQRGGPLPCRHVADILWQTASVLEKAAQAGIIHRDIKPDNILLSDEGEVKVADFGLVRIGRGNSSNSSDATALTQVGMTLGTPLYMSPEQAQGKDLDHRSDMYSLGITCYHALTGQPPFRAETPLAVALMHVNQAPEPLEKHRQDIPAPLSRIVHRMIEKRPEDRFQSFQEIRQELRGLFTVYLQDTEAAHRLTDWNQFPLSRSDEQLLLTTEKLQRIMKREKELKAGSRHFLRRPRTFALIFLLGLLAGYLWTATRPSLLHEPTSELPKKCETVEEQWVYACILDSPDAWNSVIEYFPEEEYLWGRKAKRQLIRYYFLQGDRGNTLGAFPLFLEFAGFSNVDIEDQALGLAGLAWCAAENRDEIKAAEHLRHLYELQFSYSDPLLFQILDATYRAMQQHP